LLVWAAALIAVLVASVCTVSIAVALRAASGKLLSSELSDPASSPIASSPGWFIAGAVVTQATVGAVLGLVLRVGKFDGRAILPLRRAPVSAFAGALLVTFGMAPLAQVVGELMSRFLRSPSQSSLIVSRMAQTASSVEFGVLLACLSLLPALVEESMFRGYMTAAFSKYAFWTRALVPSLFFGVFHLEPIQGAATVLLGLAFGLARLYSGSLLPSMLAHAVYNGSVLLVARALPGAEDHEIQAFPVLIGAGLLALGLGLLRGAVPSGAHKA
jgi:membrane protease YdiL (CAAX protease family)